jgi:hypothetical protein
MPDVALVRPRSPKKESGAMKARLYRMALTVSMLALTVEALGAPKKW